MQDAPKRVLKSVQPAIDIALFVGLVLTMFIHFFNDGFQFDAG